MTTKLCRRCNKTLPLDAFGIKQKGIPKRYSQCRECRNELHFQWLRKTKEAEGNLFARVRLHDPARAGRLDKYRLCAKNRQPMDCGDLIKLQPENDEYGMFYMPEII